MLSRDVMRGVVSIVVEIWVDYRGGGNGNESVFSGVPAVEG